MRSPKKGNTPFGPVSRRRFVATAAAGATVSVAGLALGDTSAEARLLRPPGAIEEKGFVSLCARCGRCVPVCPSSALRLQGLGEGLKNLMTPKLVPSKGHCIMPINGCQNCIQACPAKVLQPLVVAGLPSGQLSKVLKIGTAILDTRVCIPYAEKQPCLACKEICPVEGAITTQGGQGKGIGGSISKPVFHPGVCVGCGACEFACPTSPKAVVVSSEGAKRTTWRD